MATLPATALGEIRLNLNLPDADGTTDPVTGYAWLYPNLEEGTPYRATGTPTMIAARQRLEFDTAGTGNLEDPDTGTWAKVLGGNAPGHTHPGMQWLLDIHIDNVEPRTIAFDVPAGVGAFVDVGDLVDPNPQPSVQTVVIAAGPVLDAANQTEADRIATEQARAQVEQLLLNASATPSTPRATFTPPNNRGYVRLCTLDGVAGTTGAHIEFLLSGTGDFGVAERGTHLVHVVQRGANYVQLRAWSFGHKRTAWPVEFYTKQISTYVFEVWARFANFNQLHDLHTLGAWNATLNLNGATSSTPAGLVARPVREMDGPRPFRFDEYTPAYYSMLNGLEPTVVQSFVFNRSTGDLFTAQVDPSQSGVSESVRLQRLSRDGAQVLDSMILQYAGHGTNFHLEQIGTTTWVIMHWFKTVDGTGTGTEYGIARFPYTPGATWANTNAGIQWLASGQVYYVPFGDQKNGLLGLRYTEGGVEKVTVHTLANAKASNFGAPVYSLSVPASAGAIFQGSALDGNHLYWLTGPSNGAPKITQFDLQTGGILAQMEYPAPFGEDPNGAYEDADWEPEAVHLYDDPQTGAKSLFFGFATGTNNNRNNKLYAFHSTENAAHFMGERLQRYDRLFMHDTDWIDIVPSGGGLTFADLDAESRPQYRRLGGEVQLRGVLNATTTGITAGLPVFQFPVGFRPTSYKRFTHTSSAPAPEKSRRINVGTGGNLELNFQGSDAIKWQSLDGLCWEAAAAF